MKNKINQKEKTEKWNEIIDTANNGDPKYSFRLFSELLEKENTTKTKYNGGKKWKIK